MEQLNCDVIDVMGTWFARGEDWCYQIVPCQQAMGEILSKLTHLKGEKVEVKGVGYIRILTADAVPKSNFEKYYDRVILKTI